MATHCSILAWRIPWTEEPGGNCKELDMTVVCMKGDEGSFIEKS